MLYIHYVYSVRRRFRPGIGKSDVRVPLTERPQTEVSLSVLVRITLFVYLHRIFFHGSDAHVCSELRTTCTRRETYTVHRTGTHACIINTLICVSCTQTCVER